MVHGHSRRIEEVVAGRSLLKTYSLPLMSIYKLSSALSGGAHSNDVCAQFPCQSRSGRHPFWTPNISLPTRAKKSIPFGSADRGVLSQGDRVRHGNHSHVSKNHSPDHPVFSWFAVPMRKRSLLLLLLSCPARRKETVFPPKRSNPRWMEATTTANRWNFSRFESAMTAFHRGRRAERERREKDG
jgi:hypothetical protein